MTLNEALSLKKGDKIAKKEGSWIPSRGDKDIRTIMSCKVIEDRLHWNEHTIPDSEPISNYVHSWPYDEIKLVIQDVKNPETIINNYPLC